MRIGLISDTHGWLDPQVAEHFAGVDHILHAGDVGQLSVLHELRAVAAVTAVLGNVDFPGMGLRDTECVELGGSRFLLHHIVNPAQLGDHLKAQLAEWSPDFVVFGHSHRAFNQRVRGRRFVNPGYAGRPRFNQPRSIAIADGGAGEWRIQAVPLPDPPAWSEPG